MFLFIYPAAVGRVDEVTPGAEIREHSGTREVSAIQRKLIGSYIVVATGADQDGVVHSITGEEKLKLNKKRGVRREVK